MEFEMMAYKQTEFELILRSFAQKNNFFAGKTPFSYKGQNAIATVADNIIGKLSLEQLNQLKAIK
jgi:hypothetical protein